MFWLSLLFILVIFLIAIVLLIYSYKDKQEAMKILSQAENKLILAKKEIETERNEALIKLKEELYKKRQEFDNILRSEKIEIEKVKSRLNTKNEIIENKERSLDQLRSELSNKEQQLLKDVEKLKINEKKVEAKYNELIKKLEEISYMSSQEAKDLLLKTLENEVNLSNQKWILKTEEDARQFAKDKAISIVVSAMQRYTADQVNIITSSTIHLPNDEMKGRIIGKEGRNIKALEMATGMEFLIGETPETITISGFNPIRKEIAKRSLEKLILDGRINPTKIEETVAQCEKEIEDLIKEYGKSAILQFNLQGIKQEIVSLLGKLHFRTSFAQNVLTHSIEVAIFARIIAEELGLEKPHIALRGGLLHDIGKAVSAEVEGPHALIGADIARRCGEDPLVVNAIAAHHEEVPFISIYSPIVLIADTISASRPGARRETLSTYIKRLEKLESIGLSFEGVKKAYAFQAGREIRVIVEEDILDDDKTILLARDIAKKIEQEMSFPGQIKVNVIREKRVIQYAK
jgi:ribonuclease Y